jgi:cyclopropane-fatty-acyl-phospholipid synthase
MGSAHEAQPGRNFDSAPTRRPNSNGGNPVRNKVLERALLVGLRRFVRQGCLTVVLPTGRELRVGTLDANHPGPVVTFIDYQDIKAVLRDPSMGFAKGFARDRITVDDLQALLEIVAVNTRTGPIAQTIHRLLHRPPRNDVGTHKDQIGKHYNLNPLYQLFLGGTMCYTCADDLVLKDWESADDLIKDLDEAQNRKCEHILDAGGVTAGTAMLDIGCGWCELAIHAAKRGAPVDGLTLSEDQLALGHQRIQNAGVSAHVALELEDIFVLGPQMARDYPGGVYDVITSVEMVEAVGHSLLPDYHRIVRDLLVPGGCTVLQVIVSNNRAKGLRKPKGLASAPSNTWVATEEVDEYGDAEGIFPGGYLPFSEEILEGLKLAGLVVESVQSLRDDYVATLIAWLWLHYEHEDEIVGLYNRRLFNRRVLWLVGCIVAFGQYGHADVLRIVARKPA